MTESTETATAEHLAGILAEIGDTLSPTGERPAEALGTLARDVRAVADQRDALAVTLAALRALYVDLADGPPVNGDWLLGELGRLTRGHEPATPAYVLDNTDIWGPAALSYADWTRYERTCAPDRQLDGLGDLCMFLGGSWSETPGASSFTGELLKLIVKAQSTPAHLAALERGFPREVLAWRTWMGMSPTPTAAELCAELTTREDAKR